MYTSRRVFLKQLGVSTVATGLLSLGWTPSVKGGVYLAKPLPRSDPEKQGVSSLVLDGFLEAIAKSKIEFHSVMVLRHGMVIGEGWWSPYSPDYLHTLYSLSKSFTSTAVGLAINEGKFTVDSPVVSFFPNDLPAKVSPNLQAMQVKHLLSMATGHAKDTINPIRTGNSNNWAKAFLEIPVEHAPGTHFVYNTGATYMLSAIVQKTTGEKLIDYLRPRLFEPLGISGMDWETNAEGYNVGGYGLRLKTEDIARFGQLYLQNGKWMGDQLIPAAWVAEATQSHIDNAPQNPTKPNEQNDWAQGYGYQFWRCTQHAFRGDGAFGQFCVMLPEQDAVVVITSESFDLPATLNLVWSHLLPGMQPQEMPVIYDAQQTMKKKFQALAIPPPPAGTSTLSSSLTGKKIILNENPFNTQSITFSFAGDACLMTLNGSRKTELFCGLGRWLTLNSFSTQQVFGYPGRPDVPTPVACAAHWIDDKNLEITLRYLATAHSDHLIFTFQQQEVTIKFQSSVSRGNPAATDPRKPITAKLT